MPRESCLSHRRGDKIVLIRDSFVRLFAGDHCCAAILGLLEYLTTNELERMEKAEETGNPWIRASLNQICADMMDHYSRRMIQDRLSRMKDWEILATDANRLGAINSYLLNVDRVNQL